MNPPPAAPNWLRLNGSDSGRKEIPCVHRVIAEKLESGAVKLVRALRGWLR